MKPKSIKQSISTLVVSVAATDSGPVQQYAISPQQSDVAPAVGNVGVWGGTVDAWGRPDSGSPGSSSSPLQRWIESTALEAMQEKGREVWERALAKWQPNKGSDHP